MESFKGLKSKLEELETNFKVESIVPEVNLDERVKSVLNSQSDRIQLNVCGHLYTLSKASIYNCIHDNILADELKKIDNIYYSNIGDKTNIICLDFNKHCFDLILRILRNNNQKRIQHYLTYNEDVTQYEKEITMFYKNANILNNLEIIPY